MNPPDRRPCAVELNALPVIPAAQAPSGTAIARLITKRDTGSDIVFGASWMEPGDQSFEWTMTDETESGDRPSVAGQEIYYVVRGRLRVTWDDGELEAGPDAAIYFPPGWRYQVTAISDEPVFLVYALHPASV
jgi:ethanolamine utilization protein EutQ (cupin superfamily)